MHVLVTLDANARLYYWPYRRDNFGAFGMMMPALKFKLDLTVQYSLLLSPSLGLSAVCNACCCPRTPLQLPTFDVSGHGQGRDLVFPPAGLKLPRNPDTNVKYQKIVRAGCCCCCRCRRPRC